MALSHQLTPRQSLVHLPRVVGPTPTRCGEPADEQTEITAARLLGRARQTFQTDNLETAFWGRMLQLASACLLYERVFANAATICSHEVILLRQH